MQQSKAQRDTVESLLTKVLKELQKLNSNLTGTGLVTNLSTTSLSTTNAQKHQALHSTIEAKLPTRIETAYKAPGAAGKSGVGAAGASSGAAKSNKNYGTTLSSKAQLSKLTNNINYQTRTSSGDKPIKGRKPKGRRKQPTIASPTLASWFMRDFCLKHRGRTIACRAIVTICKALFPDQDFNETQMKNLCKEYPQLIKLKKISKYEDIVYVGDEMHLKPANNPEQKRLSAIMIY